MEHREEKDTMGVVRVPADKYWGAQTQRSKMNFPIGEPASMPKEIIYAFAYLKKADRGSAKKYFMKALELDPENVRLSERVASLD